MMELRSIFALLSLAAAFGCRAACAMAIDLARGDEATFEVSIVNETASDAPAAFHATPLLYAPAGDYVIDVPDASPCEISNGVLTDGRTFVLSVASVGAHSDVTCALRVHRANTSQRPASLFLQPDPVTPSGVGLGDAAWAFGALTDISLRVSQIAPFPHVGESVGYVRVEAHNAGPSDVGHVDFGYCQDLVIAPFALDNAVPDGCGEAEMGPGCFAVGPPSVQFGFDHLAAGETRSCVLRATALEPLTERIGMGTFLVDSEYAGNDDQVYDFVRDDDNVVISIEPIRGAILAVSTPASSLRSMLATAVLVGLVGLFAIRIRRRR
jgi:hypothetical protein